MTGEAELQFDDLPMLTSEDDVWRVHLAGGEYFVKRGGKAHSDKTCSHLDDTDFVGNPDWRVATSQQRRALGIGWCENCG